MFLCFGRDKIQRRILGRTAVWNCKDVSTFQRLIQAYIPDSRASSHCWRREKEDGVSLWNI